MILERENMKKTFNRYFLLVLISLFFTPFTSQTASAPQQDPLLQQSPVIPPAALPQATPTTDPLIEAHKKRSTATSKSSKRKSRAHIKKLLSKIPPLATTTEDLPGDKTNMNDLLLDLDFTAAEIARLRKENKELKEENNLLRNLIEELVSENDYILQQMESHS